MANPVSFDPTVFFEKTAQFASQGRGLFTLTGLPNILKNLEDTRINKASELLMNGIVTKSVTSPATSVATFEEFSYIGPTRKQIHTQIFGPLGVEFYLMGKDMPEAQSLHYTFMRWHQLMAGARYSSSGDKTPLSDSTFFAIEYYDNYITDAEFKVFSPWGTKSDNVSLPTPIIWNKYYEIYPQSIGQLSTSWDNSDAPLTLSVEFEFYYMQSKF